MLYYLLNFKVFCVLKNFYKILLKYVNNSPYSEKSTDLKYIKLYNLTIMILSYNFIFIFKFRL